MLAFAYTECGISVDRFFELSFYEWSLEIHKLRKQRERDKDKWESNAAFVREILAMMVNTTPREKGAKTMKGTDFYKLSFDIEEKPEVTVMSPEEVESKFPKTLND
jgi:hypothetical protein